MIKARRLHSRAQISRTHKSVFKISTNVCAQRCFDLVWKYMLYVCPSTVAMLQIYHFLKGPKTLFMGQTTTCCFNKMLSFFFLQSEYVTSELIVFVRWGISMIRISFEKAHLGSNDRLLQANQWRAETTDIHRLRRKKSSYSPIFKPSTTAWLQTVEVGKSGVYSWVDERFIDFWKAVVLWLGRRTILETIREKK